jgi:hypothetical protein
MVAKDFSLLRQFSFQRATSSELNAKIDEELLTMTCRFNIGERIEDAAAGSETNEVDNH